MKSATTSLETEACLQLWRPQLRDLRIQIRVNHQTCTGRWSLINRRTKETLCEWAPYSFSCSPHDKDDPTETMQRTLNWLTDHDIHIPLHQLTALLALKDELPFNLTRDDP